MNTFKPMINNQMKKDVELLLNEYKIDIPNLHLRLDDNKYIMGIMGKNISINVKNYFIYNHFIESINDLSIKTKESILKSIEYYQLVDETKFNPMNNILSNNENKACYYLENSLFREIILWDSLAQLYNLFFKLNLSIEQINYKRIIKNLSQSNINKINFSEIYDYINELNDMHDYNKGIHKSIDDLRNIMTHRFSITITSMDEHYSLRVMPDTIYKIAKDYNTVHKYLSQIIELIIKEIENSKVIEEICNVC